MKTKVEVATEKFLAGYNCAQSVLYACSDELNLEKETALKLACGLGGGLARSGEACGAVTAAILVLGLKHGRGEHDDPSATEQTYRKTRELLAVFEQQHGSVLCRQLLQGCDLMTPEGHQHYKEHDLRRKVCLPCIQSVIALLEEIVNPPTAQPGSAGS
jgi:C_GCAxxG_C_C family probable redox protein